jgi:phosphohistidine phosphatase
VVMALYLVQHGKSRSKEIDPDQGLSEEGRAEVERIAEVAAGYGVRVSEIQNSGKKRARQTAEIFANFLNPPSGIRERDGLKPLDDVAPFLRALNSRDNLMLVGHLPFMERLTAFLITGAVEPAVFKFQNGGVVALCIDPATGLWVIQWALMPNIG